MSNTPFLFPKYDRTAFKPEQITKKLWTKLKPNQKADYLELTAMYEQELNALSKIHNGIVAHNLALQTIWKQDATKKT